MTDVLKEGLKRHNPPGHDKSGFATTKGGDIDKGATREGTAPSPKTLGPRTA
jgi:hypothetical protein